MWFDAMRNFCIASNCIEGSMRCASKLSGAFRCNSMRFDANRCKFFSMYIDVHRFTSMYIDLHRFKSKFHWQFASIYIEMHRFTSKCIDLNRKLQNFQIFSQIFDANRCDSMHFNAFRCVSMWNFKHIESNRIASIYIVFRCGSMWIAVRIDLHRIASMQNFDAHRKFSMRCKLRIAGAYITTLVST